MDHISFICEGPTYTALRRETRSRIKYYISENDDPDQFTQDEGEKIKWAVPCSNPDDVVLRVIKCEEIPIIAGRRVPCIIELEGSSKCGGGGYGTSDSGGWDNYIKKRYSTYEMLFPKEWFGVKIATDADLKDKKELKDIFDEVAKRGNLIYKNYTTDNDGAPDFRESPFNFSSFSDSQKKTLTKGMINKKFTAQVFILEYFLKKQVNNIKPLKNGISGVFPVKYKPRTSSVGKWRLSKEDLDPMLDKKGKEWTKIIRTFKEAPVLEGSSGSDLALVWDKDKCGGYFRWS